MGGSSKPAPPQVTPFVEPPAPRNPVPNFFQRGNPMAGGYRPNPAASRGAFGQRPPMPQQMPSGQPQQQQVPGLSPDVQEILRRIMAAQQGGM